ncbi:MAG: PRTRC system protein E [Spirochaetales bacterium]|nr:PRTRC system protein E [Spirochaetales bacterium]
MAITNFFSQVAALGFQGCLNLTLRRDGESLTVSVLLQNDACGDAAKAHIPPLILKGTAQELGEGFFPAIAAPVQATSQLLTNMEQFLKGQEEAKKQSAMEKKKTEKADKPATEIPPKEKKFLEAMKQVDALEAEGKFKEAWCKVPQPTEYPDKAEMLRGRRESLKAQFAPDLFGAAQPAEPQEEEQETEPNTEEYADNEPNAEDIPDEGQGE